MFYTYILYSTRSNRYYCGQTNDIIIRLQKHNKGDVKSTKSGIPWVLIGYLPSKNRAEAMELEKKIKKRGIKRWINEHYESLIRT